MNHWFMGFMEKETSEVHQDEFIQEVPDITPQEICEALKNMKKGQVPGPGNISVELLKKVPDILMEMLVYIFNRFLHGEKPPTEWKEAIISSIYKKGNRSDCKNYRGISVISTLARLYGRVLKNTIEIEFS